MITRIFKIFVFLMLVVVLQNSARAEDTISIGVLSSLSDEWAAMGKNVLEGVELARDEINARGGINGKKIELKVEDSLEALSGARAVSAYQSLRSSGIQFFIGPLGSGAGLSLAPIVAKDDALMISPLIGIKDFSEFSTKLFNARGVDEGATRLTAQQAFAQGLRRAAILTSQQPWDSTQAASFKNEFESLGGEVVALESPVPEATDLKTEVSKILAAGPDLVFLANTGRMPVVAKLLSSNGYKGPRFSTLLDASFVELAQGRLEGTVFSAFSYPSSEFSQKYQKHFSRKPELAADTAYDSLLILAEALRTSKSLEPAKVAAALAITEIQGASGKLSFDQNRLARRTLVKFQVVNSVIIEFNEGE